VRRTTTGKIAKLVFKEVFLTGTGEEGDCDWTLTAKYKKFVDLFVERNPSFNIYSHIALSTSLKAFITAHVRKYHLILNLTPTF